MAYCGLRWSCQRLGNRSIEARVSEIQQAPRAMQGNVVEVQERRVEHNTRDANRSAGVLTGPGILIVQAQRER